MFYCGWPVMPLTVASECSQSQLVSREISRNQGFLRCSFSLGEVPAAPASRCGLAPVICHLTAMSGMPSDQVGALRDDGGNHAAENASRAVVAAAQFYDFGRMLRFSLPGSSPAAVQAPRPWPGVNR